MFADLERPVSEGLHDDARPYLQHISDDSAGTRQVSRKAGGPDASAGKKFSQLPRSWYLGDAEGDGVWELSSVSQRETRALTTREINF